MSGVILSLAKDLRLPVYESLQVFLIFSLTALMVITPTMAGADQEQACLLLVAARGFMRPDRSPKQKVPTIPVTAFFPTSRNSLPAFGYGPSTMDQGLWTMG